MLNEYDVTGQFLPVADHHQHLFSPAIVEDLAGLPQALLARDVVALLDLAGIHSALLLSAAYMYGSPKHKFADEYDKVKAENDWVASEAIQYPDRLRAFFAVNPLKEYALDEITRCAGNLHLRHGMKLHFGNSDVQLNNPAHVEQLQRVFQAANAHRMAIAVHLRASISKNRPYGAAEAHMFLEQVLPLVPDIPVQVAHLAGSGPGYDDPPAQQVMAVLADAVEQRDPRTNRLWFDVATVVDANISPVLADMIVRRIRQVGVERILYGSDAAIGDNLRPRQGWAAFRRLPLREDEFSQIASQVAPYLRF
jgi:predicted TIM-barrel fold metal-dependent hydrolase